MAAGSRVNHMSECVVCKKKGETRLDLRSHVSYCGTHYIMIKQAEATMDRDLSLFTRVVPRFINKRGTCVDSDI